MDRPQAVRSSGWQLDEPPTAASNRSILFSSPLSAAMLNLEAKSRSNLFPWRGQFSPQLVEALLRAYAVPGSAVLDPFMGSGTVLVEAARLGLPAYGCEINPAAFLLSRLYELCNVELRERRELLAKAREVLEQARPAIVELPLFRFSEGEPLPSDNGHWWAGKTTDPRVQSLLDALVVLLDEDAERDDRLGNKWSLLRSIVVNLPVVETPVRPELGDARALLLPDAAIDFVLSSPPYINVFNYHHNSRFGVEALGWKPLVVARSEIGSNRKFRQNRFLTVVQYCLDMALALAELRRVCADEGRVLLILGRESNVHKTAFYNGQILERLAVEVVGLSLELRQERVFTNRFGNKIYEDLLHLSPQMGPGPPRDELLRLARCIGKQALLDALGRVPSDRQHYLRDALERADEVPPSPILQPATTLGVSR